MHGKKDQIVPFRNALKLQKTAKDRVTLIVSEKAGHYNLQEKLQDDYWKAYEDFIGGL